MRKIIKTIFFIGLAAGLFGFARFASAATISTTINNNSNLTFGLVGWWTFDGTSVTSTGVVDKSGNNNTGTLVGGVTKVAGKIGQGMKFDGSTGYINGSGLSSGTNLPVTISAWIYPKGVGGRQTIFGRGATGACMGYELFLNNTILWGGGNGDFSLGGTIVNNKWQHVVAVYNGSTITGYVNGVKYLSPAGGSDTCGGTTWDVGSYNTNAYLFNGSIDDVRVYNRALSAAEVQQLYKMGGGKISKTPAPVVDPLKNGLVGWWTFDGASVTSTGVVDKSGKNNAGALTGGITKVSGKVGQALKLNNGTDAVFLDTVTGLSSSAVTYSVWIKRKNQSTGYVVFAGDNANADGIFMSQNSDNVYLQLKFTTAGNTTTPDVTTDNNWHLWTATWSSGQKINLYKDGVLSGQSASVITDTLIASSILRVGYYTSGFDGVADDVRVYSRALSAAEIQQLYKQGGGKISKTDLITAQLRDGLVGHWTFDGTSVTSTGVVDQSGQNDNGVRNGGTSLVRGKIGQGMKFDGTSGYILTTNVNAFTGTLPFSVSVWFKANNIGTTQTVISEWNGGYSGQFKIYLAANSLRFIRNVAGVVISNALTSNKWYHAVSVYDGINEQIYIDGIVSGAPAASGFSTGGNVQTLIGMNYFAGVPESFFGGLIDDVRIYNRALSAQEVYQLYKMGK